jgi:hypothetical protein
VLPAGRSSVAAVERGRGEHFGTQGAVAEIMLDQLALEADEADDEPVDAVASDGIEE